MKQIKQTPKNAAKSILAHKKNNRKKAIDSADEVIDKDENKDKKPWWDMFGCDWSCCGTERNAELDKKIEE